jgi:hypothetical protein
MMHTYVSTPSPTNEATKVKTVWWMLNKYKRRPKRKRSRERCSKCGNNSTASGKCNLSTLSKWKAWISARLCGLCRGCWVTVRYRRTYCCNITTSRPHIRLVAKLRNQSVSTQIAYFRGEKGGGLAGGARIDARDTLGSASSS